MQTILFHKNKYIKIKKTIKLIVCASYRMNSIEDGYEQIGIIIAHLVLKNRS